LSAARPARAWSSQEEATTDAGPFGELEVQRVEGDEFRFDPVGQFAKERQEVVRIPR